METELHELYNKIDWPRYIRLFRGPPALLLLPVPRSPLRDSYFDSPSLYSVSEPSLVIEAPASRLIAELSMVCPER